MTTQPPPPPPADEKDWTVVLTAGCSQCGFSPEHDPATTGERIRATVPRWQSALSGIDVKERPWAEVWSPLEYACHVRDVFRVFSVRLGLMLATDGAKFDNWDQDEAAVSGAYWSQDPAAVADELAEAGESLAAAFDAVLEDAWGNRGLRSNGADFTVATFAAYLLHDIEHHLHDVDA